MIVKDLIKQLQQLDPNSEVLMQIDDERNGYRTLNGVDEDEAIKVDYDDYVFLSQYGSVQEMQEDYDLEEFDFFSVSVLY